ncbi:unnamed protein product [Cunninghamella blakesleeana]
MESYTLTLQCVDDICYCDWRLSIYGCINSIGLKIIYLILTVLSGLVSMLSFGIFLYRWHCKGHKLFDLHSKSILKPKPIDCLMFFLGIFNFLRMLDGIILVADISPDNILARSFMFEFPWQFGFAACALYLLGIAQTLADSHKSSTKEWLPSPRTVDVIGIIIIFAPVLLNNICSIASGILANRQLDTAVIFVRILYVLWFLHCTTAAIIIMVLGIRLLKTLQTNVKNFRTSGEKYKAIKTGMFKIKLLVIVIATALSGYGIFLLVYCILRDQIIQDVPGSYALCIIWNYLGPVATFCADLAVIANPKVGDKSSFGLPNSSNTGQGTTNNTLYTSTQGNGGTGLGVHSSTLTNENDQDFKGTLSAQAYQTLKQMKDEMDYSGYPFASFEHHPKKDVNHHQEDYSTAIHLQNLSRN